MKNGKKIFILVETFLGLMVFVLVMFMFLEKNEKKQEKISVIIQNSDDSQWQFITITKELWQNRISG